MSFNPVTGSSTHCVSPHEACTGRWRAPRCRLIVKGGVESRGDPGISHSLSLSLSSARTLPTWHCFFSLFFLSTESPLCVHALKGRHWFPSSPLARLPLHIVERILSRSHPRERSLPRKKEESRRSGDSERSGWSGETRRRMGVARNVIEEALEGGVVGIGNGAKPRNGRAKATSNSVPRATDERMLLRSLVSSGKRVFSEVRE